MKAIRSFVVCAVISIGSLAVCQTRDIRPEDPTESLKSIQVSSLIERARLKVRDNQVEAATALYQQAASIQATMIGFKSGAWWELGRLYAAKGRTELALEAYAKVFRWDGSKRDIVPGAGDHILVAMEYATLLAKAGRGEDAKAMYYYGLRNLNPGQTRSVEPAPFLMVFDPEPEGAVLDYTPERLEAAALVVAAMCGGTMDLATRKQVLPEELANKASQLAPEWFYPLLFKAARSWQANWAPALLAEAESLAKPGLESQLVARYRQELAEHKALIEAEEMFGAEDTRPMREGNERRARMRCVQPNDQVLKRLSVQLPGK